MIDFVFMWAGMDLNHRTSEEDYVYSVAHLTTLLPTQILINDPVRSRTCPFTFLSLKCNKGLRILTYSEHNQYIYRVN